MEGDMIPVWIPESTARILLPRLEQGIPPTQGDCIFLAQAIRAALTGQNQPSPEPNNPT